MRKALNFTIANNELSLLKLHQALIRFKVMKKTTQSIIINPKGSQFVSERQQVLSAGLHLQGLEKMRKEHFPALLRRNSFPHYNFALFPILCTRCKKCTLGKYVFARLTWYNLPVSKKHSKKFAEEHSLLLLHCSLSSPTLGPKPQRGFTANFYIRLIWKCS